MRSLPPLLPCDVLLISLRACVLDGQASAPIPPRSGDTQVSALRSVSVSCSGGVCSSPGFVVHSADVWALLTNCTAGTYKDSAIATGCTNCAAGSSFRKPLAFALTFSGRFAFRSVRRYGSARDQRLQWPVPGQPLLPCQVSIAWGSGADHCLAQPIWFLRTITPLPCPVGAISPQGSTALSQCVCDAANGLSGPPGGPCSGLFARSYVVRGVVLLMSLLPVRAVFAIAPGSLRVRTGGATAQRKLAT